MYNYPHRQDPKMMQRVFDWTRGNLNEQQLIDFGLACISEAQQRLNKNEDQRINKVNNNSILVNTLIPPVTVMTKSSNCKIQSSNTSANGSKNREQNYNERRIKNASVHSNRIISIVKDRNELEEWIDDIKVVEDYTFENDKDNKTLSAQFKKSMELEFKQKQRLKDLCDKHKRGLQDYTQTSQQINKLSMRLQKQTVKIEENQKSLKEGEHILRKLRTKATNAIREYNENYTKYTETSSSQITLKHDKEETKQQLAMKMELATKYKTLLTKYNQFNQETIKYTREMAILRERRFEQFESKWLEWDYNDIIFWFKVKLRYFDCIYSIREEASWDSVKNNNKKNKNKNREESKQNESDDINFGMVQKELEEQRIRGKFLSLINRSDLRNLGFILFEHQCILEKEIATLVDKYPIPKPRLRGGIADNSQVDTIASGADDSGTIKDDKYRCPITKKIMKEPVIACDNKTYEKNAILII